MGEVARRGQAAGIEACSIGGVQAVRRERVGDRCERKARDGWAALRGWPIAALSLQDRRRTRAIAGGVYRDVAGLGSRRLSRALHRSCAPAPWCVGSSGMLADRWAQSSRRPRMSASVSPCSSRYWICARWPQAKLRAIDDAVMHSRGTTRGDLQCGMRMRGGGYATSVEPSAHHAVASAGRMSPDAKRTVWKGIEGSVVSAPVLASHGALRAGCPHPGCDRTDRSRDRRLLWIDPVVPVSG